MDYQAAPEGQTTFLSNFKALLAHSPGRLPDIAAGLQNVATGQKAVPYLVATTQPRATGFTLGLIRPSGGAYYSLVTVWAASPRMSLPPWKLSRIISAAAPNSAGDGLNPCGYVVNLSYVFHLKGQRSSAPGTAKNPAAGAGGAGK